MKAELRTQLMEELRALNARILESLSKQYGEESAADLPPKISTGLFRGFLEIDGNLYALFGYDNNNATELIGLPK